MLPKKATLITITSLGTLLEWAEYTFYGYMAITLSPLFFPTQSPHIALLKTFGIFAVGYIMRPLGAIIFGYIGDKIGRQSALVFSILLMGLATFGIGCLPTYDSVGYNAAVLLLTLRMIQGLAVSGEYNGAGIFLIERIGERNPCLAGSWISASAALGMVLGGLAAFIVSLPSMPNWAWRIPFLLGGISCFIALWLRLTVSGSDFVTKPKRPPHQFPLLNVFQQYKSSMLITSAIAAITGVYVYIGNIYIVVFLKMQSDLPSHHATFFAIFGELVVAIMIPIMAYVADKTDAYRQYRWGLLGITFFTPGMFILCTTGRYLDITLAMLIYGVLNGILCGPMVKIFCDQFPISVRYTGISFAYSFSAAIFSGTAPLVAQYLTTQYQWSLGPSFYVAFVALLTYFILLYFHQQPPAFSAQNDEMQDKAITYSS